MNAGRRLCAALILWSLLSNLIACGAPKTPHAPDGPSTTEKSKEPDAPPRALAAPFEQPKSCPPPLTWEDGKPIEISQVCPEQPQFFFHEGVCCRYQNDCLAPEGAASFAKLEQCEKVRTDFEERAKRAPRCKPGELVWQPSFCAFASCDRGEFVTPGEELADCQRPLGPLELRFEQDQKNLSTNQIGELENLAVMAGVLGVKGLRVEGGQSYDETPAAKSKNPLSLQRANAVRDGLAQATRIPIEVRDGGTASRLRGSASLFRTATVTMAPLADDHSGWQTKPFTLPWKYCESRVTFRTEIALTKHDGEVVVEVCREAVCSRGTIDAAFYAAWPGGGGAEMRGALDASQSLDATRRQIIRNGLNALQHGGLPTAFDGEKPASFAFEVFFRDPAISEASTYRFRLFRRRTEIALDWSGKLTFQRTLRHPTRDPAPCLQAELEIPRAQHLLR